MHNRFRRASYALAGGVAVAAALGLTAAGVASAGARPSGKAHVNATVNCGASCDDEFNKALGPMFIPNTAGHYGSDVDLAVAHNSAPSEDFHFNFVGTLAQLIAGHKISPTSYVALNYPGTDPVFEIEFIPNNVTTGLCAGVSKKNLRAGGEIDLRDCGSSARVLWVDDVNNAVPDARSTALGGVDIPEVNAGDTSFTHALVLTTNDFGSLFLAELSRNGGAVSDNQLWGDQFGPAI